MIHQGNWKRKLEEVSTQIKTGYAQVGRKTGAAHLGVVYPPEVLDFGQAQIVSMN